MIHFEEYSGQSIDVRIFDGEMNAEKPVHIRTGNNWHAYSWEDVIEMADMLTMIIREKGVRE